MPPELDWVKVRFGWILSKVVWGIVYWAKRGSCYSSFWGCPNSLIIINGHILCLTKETGFWEALCFRTSSPRRACWFCPFLMLCFFQRALRLILCFSFSGFDHWPVRNGESQFCCEIPCGASRRRPLYLLIPTASTSSINKGSEKVSAEAGKRQDWQPVSVCVRRDPLSKADFFTWVRRILVRDNKWFYIRAIITKNICFGHPWRKPPFLGAF